MKKEFRSVCLLTVLFLLQKALVAQQVGVFDNHNDVGAVQHAGSATYDSLAQQYTVSGSGANIWGANDQFHFLWKRMSGDFILQARGAFIGKGVDPHRKWGWMIRNSLDSSAAMASVHIHGDGLAAFQYRKERGSNIEEKRSAITAPDVIQLERRGNTYIMSVARFGDPFTETQLDSLSLSDEVYVGLFVCAHNNDVVEQAVFSNVRLIVPAGKDLVPYRHYLGSHIETMDVTTGQRQVVYSEPVSLQAPNWTPDGKTLIYNSKGLMYRLDLGTQKPEVIPTGNVKANNNDHVLSFDGKMLGLSSSSADPKWGSIVYTVPVQGGTPKQITPTGPSYLHGWSPDGKWLTFTGQRNNEFDIYKIPSGGGKEIRLTTTPGLDDGAEYTPNGKYIYFNSVRSGTMQLWRMKPDGSSQEQVTNDEYNNWFPHISPDGKWIAFLSFMPDVKPEEHPFYKHVYLRLMPVSGGTPKVIGYVYGGQGTINTPSWAPDSKRIAFVSNTDMK
jgi:Tol biopolymer transport system component